MLFGRMIKAKYNAISCAEHASSRIKTARFAGALLVEQAKAGHVGCVIATTLTLDDRQLIDHSLKSCGKLLSVIAISSRSAAKSSCHRRVAAVLGIALSVFCPMQLDAGNSRSRD